MRLEHIKIPWKKLEDSLNYIVDGVNANEPIEGTGIRISDGSRGKIIETAPGAGGGQAPTWMTVIIVDPVTCVQTKIQVWARKV